jgi:hypothetical protein
MRGYSEILEVNCPSIAELSRTAFIRARGILSHENTSQSRHGAPSSMIFRVSCRCVLRARSDLLQVLSLFFLLLLRSNTTL